MFLDKLFIFASIMPGKLEKFADFKTFRNCFSLPYEALEKGFDLKGKWHRDFFHNNHPIVLELGCGRGEYSVGLAKQYPEKNFIGVDIKGNRIWTGAKESLEKKLDNVAFIRTRIDFIDYCFAENEVSEIWITFPDPQPQQSRERKRLTGPMFLNRYKKFLKPGGIIHLKTDNTGFYEYTLEVIREEGLVLHYHTADLYLHNPTNLVELTSIQTRYEKLFSEKGERIKYCAFSFPND